MIQVKSGARREQDQETRTNLLSIAKCVEISTRNQFSNHKMRGRVTSLYHRQAASSAVRIKDGVSAILTDRRRVQVVRLTIFLLHEKSVAFFF